MTTRIQLKKQFDTIVGKFYHPQELSEISRDSAQIFLLLL